MDRVDTVKRVRGWTRHHDYGLPRPGGLRRADPALDPLRSWERHSRPGAYRDLGTLLATRGPQLHPLLHAVTGVALTQDATESRQTAERYAQPSVHLRRRLDLQLPKR